MGNLKYNFDNVLVANTKLLIQMNNTQPQVLILNGKLNKCSKSGNNSISTGNATTTCSSCCLQIENSEFRRRSNIVPDISGQTNSSQSECFANCGEKRTVDVELQAKAQLSGKIVILAVTQQQLDIVGNYTINYDSTLECQISSSWSFLKFNPKFDQVQQQNSNKKQTYYARFNSLQLPNINIQSMTINQDSKTNREKVSLAIDVPKLIKRSQHYITKETLLVNEFNCTPSIDRQTVLNEKQSRLIRMNLLALINREIPPQNNNSIIMPVNKVAEDKQQRIRSFEQNDKRIELINKNISSTIVTDIPLLESSFVDQSVKTSSSSNITESYKSTTTTVAPQTIITVADPAINLSSHLDSRKHNDVDNKNSITNDLIESNVSQQPYNIINQRMDSSSIVTTIARANNFLATIPTSLHNYNISNNQIRLSSLDSYNNNSLLSTSTNRIGPIYLTELESIKLRLKSNSLLMFTVVSSVIILTYTLCLLVYLRTRSRQQTNSISSSSNSSSNRIFKQKNKQLNRFNNSNLLIDNNQDQQRNRKDESSKNNNIDNTKTSDIIEISEPFNLQMSSATRTRLDMMLGDTRIRKANRKQRINSNNRRLYNNNDNNNNQQSLIDCCGIHNVIINDDDDGDYDDDNNSDYIIDSDGHYSHCLPQNSCLILPPDRTQSHIINNNNELYQDVPEFSSYQPNSFNYQTHFLNQQLQQQPQQYYTYSPIDFVRAIRDAATMAKTRFKSSSFKPHLNVIPESDLEYLQQTTPKEELELFASIISEHLNKQHQQLDNNYHPSSSLPDCISAEEFNSLVEEAMSHECSHKIYQQVTTTADQKHNINTLFSKPQTIVDKDKSDKNIKEAKTIRFSTPVNERSVSRSQILKQITKDTS